MQKYLFLNIHINTQENPLSYRIFGERKQWQFCMEELRNLSECGYFYGHEDLEGIWDEKTRDISLSESSASLFLALADSYALSVIPERLDNER